MVFLVTTLPVVYPTWKVYLEFYIWDAIGGWENIFHFTLGSDNTGAGHRHPALFMIKEGNHVKLLISAFVNGNHNGKYSIVDKDTWISLEYGIV